MVHFTCDLCGTDLSTTGAPRYEVRIVAYPVHSSDRIRDEDLAEDNLEAVSQLLQRIEEQGGDHEDLAAAKGFRYDLCPECFKRYRKNPLNREKKLVLEFSEN